MADYQLMAGLPAVRVDADYYVRFEAIDPDDGSAVTGVTVSASVIFADGEASDVAGAAGANWFLPAPPD